jgi:F-type H+-transporting ATPase subunit alpha
MTELQRLFEETFRSIEEARNSFSQDLLPREVGKITSVSPGIVQATGLPRVGFLELVELEKNLFGMVFNLDEDGVGIIPLGDSSRLQAGALIRRTGRVMDVPVGFGLQGRVINPLGEPLDGRGPVIAASRLPIERPAPSIMDRAPVQVQLQTGVKVVDAMVPIGRGQRELILGDRKTGKTALAIDAILNQHDQNVICVYCAICQRSASVAKYINILKERGAMDYTVVLVSQGDDPAGLNFIAPYAATSIAEYFMEQGRDVLIVYDDLVQHARKYRELSLLLRRPPGRSAFPGDIFYIHSRLLERSTHLRPELKGGSLTALPVVETQGQNITSYIATNLISITDGQVYVSPNLFGLGILPAVDVTKSVSRVGGKAQPPAYRDAASPLKLAYAQFEELEEFLRYGAKMDERSEKIIQRGRRIRACMQQPDLHPVSYFQQLVLLIALSEGLFDTVPLEKMVQGEQAIYSSELFPIQLRDSVIKTGKLSLEDRKVVVDAVQRILRTI